MAIKKTKRDLFNELLKNYNLTGELVDFINHELTLLDRKNSRDKKPTKTQVENEVILADILAFMEVGKQYSTTDIQKALDLESNQKTSALLKKLKDRGLIIREEVKGKALFTKDVEVGENAPQLA